MDVHRHRPTLSGGSAFTGVTTFGGYVFGLKAVQLF
jgi:hypothetical protein